MSERTLRPGAGSRLTHDRVDTYPSHIRSTFAHLVIESAHLESAAGSEADVLVVNNSMVFRFPRTSGGVEPLAVETAILRAIRGRVPMPTPEPVYETLSARGGS